MSILETVLNNPKIVQQIAGQFGLSNDQASSVMGPMLSQLTSAMKGNINNQGGLEGLLKAVQNGNHGRYLDSPDQLGHADTMMDGNNILGHLLGSKDGSRAVARNAAEKSGVGYDIAKKILPLLASVMMGGLNKQASSSGLMESLGGLLSGTQQMNNNQLTGFARMLDMDGDGSMVDDVINLAGKFFGGNNRMNP